MNVSEQMKEQLYILKNMYNISSDLIAVDYDKNIVYIDKQPYTFDHIQSLINVITEGNKDTEGQYKEKKVGMDKHEEYYTIVDYRYFYIKNMVDMGFSVYDMARYFQVRPKQIEDSIKQIPDITLDMVRKENISNDTFLLIANYRDEYLKKHIKDFESDMEAAQKIGFFKVPDIKNATDKIMNYLTEGAYQKAKELYPDIDNIFSMSYEEAQKEYKKYNKALGKFTSAKFNKLSRIYHTIKDHPELYELSVCRFKDTDMAEYLNRPLSEIKEQLHNLNCNYYGRSVNSYIYCQKPGSDITTIKIATDMIKAGDKLKDISAVSGLYTHYITDLRDTLREKGEVKENFEDAKRSKIRRAQIIDLYLNSGMSQEEVAKELNITRSTVMTDIQTYIAQNPDKANEIRQKKMVNYRSSLAENVVREVLRPYGFKKILKGELYDEGLGMKGLNMYHEGKKLAVEYDGFILEQNGQKIGHTIRRDTAKDAICNDIGIDLIRLREPQLDKYESDTVKFIYTKTTDVRSKSFLNCVNELIQYLNNNYDFNIEPVTSMIPYIEKVNRTYLKNMAKYNELNMYQWKEMSNSLNARVINVKDNGLVDIQYMNGKVSFNESYKQFKKGTIVYNGIVPYVSKYINKQTALDPSTNASFAKVTGINNKNDIRLLVDDKYILYHVSLAEFNAGKFSPETQKQLDTLKYEYDMSLNNAKENNHEIRLTKNGVMLKNIGNRTIKYSENTIPKNTINEKDTERIQEHDL